MSRGEKSLDIELSRLGFKDGQYTTDPVDLLVFDRDAGIDRGTPEAVVFPESTQEVVRLVNWARQNRIPLVARGAGTGLTGGAVAETGGVILQFSRLNRLVQVDLEGRAVVFQPGVVNGVLDQLLKERDWYYPPDPGSGRSATMGGTIAENAGGPHCLKYGVTGNYINGMRVVLSNGATLQLGGTALDYPETDFVGLLTGSEGTLAIITEATARIVRRPPAVETLMVAFDSVEACGNAVSAVIAAGIIPATLEMMDQKIVRIVENYAHAGLPVEAEAVLIVEVDGYASSVSPQMEEIAEVLKRCGAYDFRPAKTEEERARIWNARKGAGGAITRLAPAYYPADATVSRSKLAATLIAINRICDEANLRVGYAVHAGDGNLHPHILIEDPTDQDLLSRVQAAGAKVMEWCVAAGGSITGEHGVGIEKRSFLSLMYNTAELQAMRDVKEVFDPVNILNPGKILPASKSWPDPPESGSRTLEGPATIKAVASSLAPSSAEEAAEAFRQWNQATGDLRVRIQGGGTKSSLLPEAGNVVSTACLKGVTECAPHDLYVSVRAGTTLEELRQELEGTGMQVPLASPWPDATIGVIVSSNFNGPLRCLYGGLRDLLLSVTAVLPDGRVLRLGRPFAKD
ncbi:MAG: FAD-binding oxidoreductase, partial [Acidobacteria bacterium]